MDPIGEPVGQIVHERRRSRQVALADPVRRDDLRVGVDRDEGPEVAHAGPIVLTRDLPLLLRDVGPDSITLKPLAGEVAHVRVEDGCATGPDLYEEAHDRVAVDARHPLRRADRAALDQAVHRLGTTIKGEAVHESYP